jgi:formate dehydrogenase subunit gamma
VGGTIVYLITGAILWAGAGTFGRTAVSISYVLHDISALIMLGGIFIHIYLSTIGEPGTFGSMIRGAVSEAWAWTFHPAWYKDVTGKDPRKSYEDALRKVEARSQD